MRTEQQLKDLFEEEARHAPGAEQLLSATMRVARVRRRRAGAAAACVAVVVAGVAFVTVVGLGHSSPVTTIAGPSPATSSPLSNLAGKPLPDPRGGSGSCVYGYSPANISQHMDFAFDGTVLSIGASRTYESGPVKWDYVPVTLAVNESFKGAEAKTATVFMPLSAQEAGTSTSAEDGTGSPSEYPVGTRLLVSGVAKWDGGDPEYPFAAFGCGGFTRYYSPDVADAWRSAMS